MQPSCAASPVSDIRTADAWSLFWAAQGPRSRCLAGTPELYAPLDAHWGRFASSVTPGLAILDIGCGTGAVARALLKAKPSLHITGVDLANVPPSQQAGLEVLPNVRMESLPFPAASFQAAVSQFGYEYGDPIPTAEALTRVVAPGGLLSFLIHHPEGPLVDAMRQHRRAIEGVCGLRIQAAFFAGDSVALSERIAKLKRECANDGLIDDAERGLHTHIGHSEPGRLQVWRAIVDALAPELMMLDSLELCCAENSSIERLLVPLKAGFELRAPRTLLTRRGDPIAILIEGTRR